MAEETLDAAAESLALPAGPCKTIGLMLDGAKGWTPTFYIRLVQDYGLEKEVKTSKVFISELILPQQPPAVFSEPVLVLFLGGPAPGLHLRGQGLRRGQDGSGDGTKMADCGQEAGVRVPLH